MFGLLREDKMKVFLTGGSGRLGQELINQFEISGIQYMAPYHDLFDITNVDHQTIKLWDLNSYDAVINTAAYVSIPACEENKDLAFKVNANCLDWLTFLLSSTQVYHISTDYVYDGDTLNSKETDLLNPCNVYAQSKAAGDMRLLSYCRSNIHILRLSFKPVIWPYKIAFDDVYTNADTVDKIASQVTRFVLKSPPGGVYNLGTPRKTLYQLAVCNNPDVEKGMLSEQLLPYTLKKEVSMDLTKFNSLRIEDEE